MTREEAIQILSTRDAHGVLCGYTSGVTEAYDMAIEALSVETNSEDLIIKGAKGIQDGIYNIQNGKLFKYKAKGGTVRSYPIVSAEVAHGWIPCSERLPSESGNYLITVADLRFGHNGEHTVTMADFYAKAKKWNSIVDVYAWMPLPKPYREESEVDEWMT